MQSVFLCCLNMSKAQLNGIGKFYPKKLFTNKSLKNIIQKFFFQIFFIQNVHDLFYFTLYY